MPTKEQITEALREVNDPELHRSIVDLGMVKGIEIEGPRVTVDIALTIPGCPLKSFFQEVVPARIKAEFSEISDVQINLGAMSEEERKALVGGVRDERAAPFAAADSSTVVVAVGSGKGGVGKSTVTTNLAVALAQRGHSVGLLDADIWGFSIPRLLGVTTRPTVIDEKLMMPIEAYGLKLISVGNFVAEDNPIVMRGPMLHKFLGEFLTNVHWDEPEYLIIDMPPGTGDISISLGHFIPGAYFLSVTTPQPAAERVAERAMHAAYKQGMKPSGVIENMSFSICETCGERTYPFGIGGGQELASKFSVPLLGQIPIDVAMRDFADHGKPTVTALPGSPSALAFTEIVDRFVELFPAKPKSKKRKMLPLIVQPREAGNGGHTHTHQH